MTAFFHEMTILDYIIVVILAVPSIIGVFKGFFKIVFRLLGIVFGFGLGIVFSRVCGDFLRAALKINSVFTSRLIAFILIFIGCWILGVLLGKLFKKLITAVKLGWLDRTFGLLFGLAEGACIVGVVCIVMVLVPACKSALTDSRIASQLVGSSVFVVSKLPSSWEDYLDPHRWIGHYRKRVIQIYKSHGKDQSRKQ